MRNPCTTVRMVGAVLAAAVWSVSAWAVTPQIATSEFHSIALASDGTIWTWGRNDKGQLGDGGATPVRTTPGRVGTDSDWVSITAGGRHFNVAIKADGSMWSWGYNGLGQLGLGDQEDRNVPTRIGTDSDWVAVAANALGATAIKADGSIWTWGSNAAGTLGQGDITIRLVPTRMGVDTDWARIRPGDHHTMAFRQDGSLWAWGKNTEGQCGDSRFSTNYRPVALTWASHLVDVAAGHWHALGLAADGTLWAWGGNRYGQLGDGTHLTRVEPFQVSADTDWAVISVGGNHAIIYNDCYHSMAIKADGSLWTWGCNKYGQLAQGDQRARAVPTRVGTDTDWIAVAGGGGYHMLGLKSDGSLWAWGRNHYGQLGDGTTVDRSLPVQIAPPGSM